MSKIVKNKPRLGRGLSSLMSAAAVEETPVEATTAPTVPSASQPAASPTRPADGSIVAVSVAQVTINPHQPRKQMDETALVELAASLKATGLIQPIVVRLIGETYQLIAGERRLRAARLAGLDSIPAIVRDVDSFTQAQMALVENIQRENLNPIDRAQAYRTLMGQLGLTQAELAGRLGEDRSSIANHLRLLELASPVQAMVSDGRLSLGHAKLLAAVADVLEQERLANLVLAQGLSVRNLERVLQDRAAVRPPAPELAASTSAHLNELERSISRQLGMKTQLRAAAKKGKGRLIIHYATLDQFDDLLGRLGVHAE